MKNKENTDQNQEMQGNNEGTGKKDFKIFKVTIILLIVIIGTLIFMLLNTYYSMVERDEEIEERVERNIELHEELDSLMKEYTVFKQQHDSVLYDKDSIIQSNAREIERLLTRQADYNRIRRQLDYLRDIAQDYVVKIDSLYVVADDLRTERDQIRDELVQVRGHASELEKDREELSSKVEVASALRAYQINADGYRLRGWLSDREEVEDRAHRVEYLRVCFKIAENPVAPAGNRNVYIRIAGPDEEILRISDDDSYAFVHNEDTLQFTIKEQVDYQGREEDICLRWDRTGEYQEGMYLVSIFTDEHRIGETVFTLR